jgi:PAS domain S-box-containing protein
VFTISMKTTDYIGPGGVPMAGNAVLMNALSRPEETAARTPKIKVEKVFPIQFLSGSLLITAVAIIWNSYALARTMPSHPHFPVVGPLLLLLCLSSWAVTGRYLLRYHRVATHSVGVDSAELERLQQQCELMRAILDNLPDHIYAKDRQGRFVLNNMAHSKSLGLPSPEVMLGKSDFDYFPRDLATQFFSDEQALIESGQPILNQEQFNPVQGKPGENYWCSASKVMWRDRQGNIIGTAGITRDIHAMKMAQDNLRRSEEKLRQSTIQLERSNRELQDFAYVASHDLQEPLRKIVVFGERLKEKCADTFTPEGVDYLERMRKAAARMQILINDLLSFSRVTTKAQPFTPVNLLKTAQEVVSDLEARIEQVQGRVELDALPLIEAEPLQMRQLLQNLIGNALKFRRPEEPPVVKVNAKIISAPRPRSGPGALAEDLCVLTVSDNCIGFEEKYLDRIFNVFQRLHTRNEYEGTGMGLAIARKIALYHGGDITATSKPGHGSTFIVTLPVTHPKAQNEQ